MDPLPSFNWCVVSVGGEELKRHQLAHHQLMNQQGPILVQTVKLIPMIKAQISGRMVCSGISILGENPSKEGDDDENYFIIIIIIIIMNKSQETKKIDFRYETRV